MGKQTLDLRRDTPIVIETPEGLIEIRKPTSPRHRGKIEVILPGESRAFVGTERALDNARFVTRKSDGTLVATYGVLVPVKDGTTGALVGVRAQQPLRIIDSASANGTDPPPPIRLAQG
jgi:hypothetical protein